LAKINDLDYLVVSARVKALENGLISSAKLDELIDSKSDEDVAKTLADAGYMQFDPKHPEEMDYALSKTRDFRFTDLADSVPDGRYMDIFKIKYDYHNVKTYLKAKAASKVYSGAMSGLGRYTEEEIVGAMDSGDYSNLSKELEEGTIYARDVLNTTRDPQLSDIALDKYMFKDMLSCAVESGSSFLTGYVKLLIDSANLKALVRTVRMGKTAEFFEGVVIDGGDVSAGQIVDALRDDIQSLGDIYASSLLCDAAAKGLAVIGGGPLTEFELACDNAVNDYLSGALYVAFGEAPLVGYLAAVETEIINLRIVLMGRNAKLDPAVIRSRLRNTYV